MPLARSKNEWLMIFKTQTNGTKEDISSRIISDLWGYGSRTKPEGRYRNQDNETLAAALSAYAYFCK